MRSGSTGTSRSGLCFSRGVAAIAAAFLAAPHSVVADDASAAPPSEAADINAPERFRAIFREHALSFTIFENTGIGQTMTVNPGWTPGEGHRGMLDSLQPLIGSLIAAASAPRAQWGEDAVDAPVLEVCCWLRFYNASIMLAADARRLGASGETRAAAERVGAIVRMAGHIGEIRHFQSAEAAETLLRFAGEEAERLMAFPGAGDPARKIIRAAIETIDPDDPAAFAGAIENQRAMVLRFIELRDTPPGTGGRDAERARKHAADSGLTTEVIDRGQAEAYFEEVAEAWSSPRLYKQVESMQWRQETGVFGARWTAVTPHPLRHVLVVERSREHLRVLRALTGTVHEQREPETPVAGEG